MNRCLVFGLFAVVCLALAGQAGAQDVFPLVDGDREAVIVGDPKALTLKGHGNSYVYEGPPLFLQGYIEQSTGRKLRILREAEYDPASMPSPIFVGDTAKARELFAAELAQFKKDRFNAYIVSVKPDFVVLAGQALWAQCDFLREYLGVDTYFPSRELGTAVPKHETVRVPVGTRIEVPVFKHRAMSGFNSWQYAHGYCGLPWRRGGRYAYHHGMHKFITPAEFGKTHPEYFPMRDGKRIIAATSNSPGPCISNPEVVRIITGKVRQYFDENPNRICISLGQTDSGFCECPACQAMDGSSVEIAGETADRSFRHFSFVNQVARALKETHPDKMIGSLAYSSTELPPKGMQIEPNVIPFLTYTRAHWYDPEVRTQDIEKIDAWLALCDQIGIYEYLYGNTFSIPRLYNHSLAEMLRYVASHSRKPLNGFYAETYANWGLDGPKLWVTDKLLWNPEQDVDELVHTWCRNVFEEAAEPMERYFNRCEQTRIKNGDRVGTVTRKFGLYRDDRHLLLFPPEDIALCMKDLEEAWGVARQDIVRRRIEYFASTFKITEITSGLYHAYTEPKRLLDEGGDGKQLLPALLKADRAAPEEDLHATIEKIQNEDSTRFMGGVEISLSTRIVNRIVNDLAWAPVYQALKAGTRDRERLFQTARDGLAPHLPADAGGSKVVADRLRDLDAMCARVRSAPRIEQEPDIDGVPDEELWQWIEDRPWYAWMSGRDVPVTTRFALAHDGRYLYLAFRCPQDDLADRKRADAYGAPGWRYTSLEFFINPDGRDADPEDTPYYQLIAIYGGGLWERSQGVVKAYKITDTPTEYRGELKIDLQEIGMAPERFPYLRINFVRNMAENGATGVAWFPSSKSNRDYASRGWLVLK